MLRSERSVGGFALRSYQLRYYAWCIFYHNSFVWVSGSRNRWFDFAQVYYNNFRILWPVIAFIEQFIHKAISSDKINMSRAPACSQKIFKCILIYGGESYCRAIFRCHITQSGPIRHTQPAVAFPEELYKLANHSLLSQFFSYRKHHVSRGRAFPKFSYKLYSNNFRYWHVIRLSEHDSFRLNSSNPPSKHSHAIHHGSMGVCSYNRIRKRC